MVIFRLGLIGTEDLDGREALDLDLLKLVGGRVHLGDDNALVVRVLLSQLVPDGDKLLAVTTPRQSS